MRSVVQDALSPTDGAPKYTLETDIEVPSPEKFDIVVQVKACALAKYNQKILTEIHKKSQRDRYSVGHDVSGIVVKIGQSVTSVALGDSVVGVVPLNARYSGCGEYCLMSEYDVVRKPDRMGFAEAAAGIGDSVKAYTALHYQARVCGGDTVLVMDGATPFGCVALHLASHWGAKVITTSSSQDERNFIDGLQISVAQVIDISKRTNILASSVMEETGGVGVDVVIDNGACMFTNEEDINIMEEKRKYSIPHKHEIISCLGASGKWITSQYNLQLDPPDCQQLFLRGASVSFLFDKVWNLSCSQHGRYQHILHDAVEKMEKGVIKCKIAKEFTLDMAVDAMMHLDQLRIGRAVVTM